MVCAMVQLGVVSLLREFGLSGDPPPPAPDCVVCSAFLYEAAKESNLPSVGLRRPAGFEALMLV
jgi:hypothetical protein